MAHERGAREPVTAGGRSRQMSPPFSPNDVADARLSDVEPTREFSVARTLRVKPSNSDDIVVGECGSVVHLTDLNLGTGCGPLPCDHVLSVLFVGSRVQMRWAHANRIVAVVANVQPAFMRPVRQQVRMNMRAPACCATNGNTAIPVRGDVPSPDPARPKLGAVRRNRSVLVDLRPEHVRQVILRGHRDLPLTRNRGATPRAVGSSDGASLRVDFTTKRRDRSLVTARGRKDFLPVLLGASSGASEHRRRSS